MEWLLYILGWLLIWGSGFIGVGNALWAWGPGGYRLGMAVWKGLMACLWSIVFGFILIVFTISGVNESSNRSTQQEVNPNY